MTWRVNFLPWREERRNKKRRLARLQIVSVVVVAVLVLLLWHTALWKKINQETRQVKNVQQQVRVQSPRQKKDPEAQLPQNKQQLLNKIKGLEKQRLRLAQIFDGLHKGVGEGSLVTQLVIKAGSISLTGKTETMFGIQQLIRVFRKTEQRGAAKIQKISRQGDAYKFVLNL